MVFNHSVAVTFRLPVQNKDQNDPVFDHIQASRSMANLDRSSPDNLAGPISYGTVLFNSTMSPISRYFSAFDHDRLGPCCKKLSVFIDGGLVLSTVNDLRANSFQW